MNSVRLAQLLKGQPEGSGSRQDFRVLVLLAGQTWHGFNTHDRTQDDSVLKD